MAAAALLAAFLPGLPAHGGSFDDAPPGDPPAGAYAVPSAEDWQRVRHPRFGFSLALPRLPVAFGNDGDGDAMTAEGGSFRFWLQVASTHQGRSLSRLAEDLDTRLLGPDRPWQTKLSGGRRTLNGLAAYEALYDGPRGRCRLVIVRLAGIDVVFALEAPADGFVPLRTTFERIVGSFAPGEASPDGAIPSAGIGRILLSAQLPVAGGTATADFQKGVETVWMQVEPLGIETGRRLLAVWYGLDAGGPRELGREEAPVLPGGQPAIFRLHPADGKLWPEGVYRVELSLEGTPLAETDFRVRSPLTGSTEGQPASGPRRGG